MYGFPEELMKYYQTQACFWFELLSNYLEAINYFKGK